MKNISTSQTPQRLLVRYSTAVTKCSIQVKKMFLLVSLLIKT